eukprot:c1196_g1_i1.p1 GENE.c1196_g1_i1~~c1196_g1_i1.p1  ORF type:complete len:372 (+),score=111.76 c1196_g1_i1:43-1116(+)
MSRKSAKYGEESGLSSDDDDSFKDAVTKDSSQGKGESEAPAKAPPKKAAPKKRKADESEDDFNAGGDGSSDSDSVAVASDGSDSPKPKARGSGGGGAAKKATPKKAKAEPKDAKDSKAKAAPKKKAAPAAGGASGGGAAGAAGATVKAVPEKEAPAVVLQYLKEKNRPYNAQTLFDNLHGLVKKAHLVRVLESLATAAQISCKEFGKNKVYFANQAEFSSLSPEELKGLDDQEKALQEEVTALKEQYRTCSTELAATRAQLTTEQAKKKIIEIEAENARLKDKLAMLQGGAPPISEEDMKQAEKLLETRMKRWRQARRGCMDVVSMICDGEGASKKPRELMADIGIETDDDVGVTMP